MPRTKVPPGSASKRSCSRASICRAANLSCCATSVSASPRSSRTRASSAPAPLMTASVILASLQRPVLGRTRVAPTQLVGEALLRDALAEPALDAQREPQRFRARRDHLVVARHQATRFVHVALAVADLAELQQRRCIVGLEPERALEELLGILGVAAAQAADTGRRIRAPRGAVERIADRLDEELDRVLLAAGIAQEPAVVVVDVRVVRREALGALEARLGELVLAQIHVNQPEHVVRWRVVGVGGGGGAQLLQRDRHAAALVVSGGEIGVDARAVARVALLANDRAGIHRRRLALAGAAREQQEEHRKPPHARSSFTAIRPSVLRVRSATSPASWPQAA